MKIDEKPDHESSRRSSSSPGEGTDRRDFLKMSAVAAVAGSLALACDDDDDITDDGQAVSLGAGDVAVLNYALALEQLEAAYYTRVTDDNEAGFEGPVLDVFNDLRDHEVVHRDFLTTALGGDAIPELQFDFGDVDFADGDAVIEQARVLEDLGVSAYNGAGNLLESADFLTVAGKIVSVEARHAAAIRDILQPNSAFFAGDDVVDEDGLDVARSPLEVLAIAADFIVDEIDADGLPGA